MVLEDITMVLTPEPYHLIPLKPGGIVIDNNIDKPTNVFKLSIH